MTKEGRITKQKTKNKKSKNKNLVQTAPPSPPAHGLSIAQPPLFCEKIASLFTPKRKKGRVDCFVDSLLG